MKKLSENFEKTEKLLFNILIATFVINLLLLGAIYLSGGVVPIWFMILVLPIGIYHVVIFFVYIYRVILFSNSENNTEVKIWRSVIGVLLSPLGLLFTFFNYMIIVLSNIW